MDISATTIWIIIALLLLGLELATGTFYMIVLSAAAAVGGVVAYFNDGQTTQVTIVAAVAVVGIIGLKRWRAAKMRKALPSENDLDIGQSVQVSAWLSDRKARVLYRGSEWDAELNPSDTPKGMPLIIIGRRGSTFIIGPNKTAD